jgi:hypothetical protein
MGHNPVYSCWLEWCNQKINCQVRYLDNRCEVKVIISPILSVDTEEQKISVAGKMIPFRNVLSIQPITN